MLSISSRRRLLIGLNVALASGIAVCFCFATFFAPEAKLTDRASHERPQAATSQDAPKVAALETHAVIYRRNLRKPLYDPKPVVARKPPPQKPRLNVELVGAVLEPGFTYGIFRTGAKQDKLLRVGDGIEGAEVLAIRQGSAVLRFHGEQITLKVKEKEVPK